MSLHQFQIGQTVRLKRSAAMSQRVPEIFEITMTLPPRENLPQYRIRSEDENHERVVTQDSLEAIGA